MHGWARVPLLANDALTAVCQTSRVVGSIAWTLPVYASLIKSLQVLRGSVPLPRLLARLRHYLGARPRAVGASEGQSLRLAVSTAVALAPVAFAAVAVAVTLASTPAVTLALFLQQSASQPG